jgi:hypothetical protein
MCDDEDVEGEVEQRTGREGGRALLLCVWSGRYSNTQTGRDYYIKTSTELEMEGSRIWLPHLTSNG